MSASLRVSLEKCEHGSRSWRMENNLFFYGSSSVIAKSLKETKEEDRA